MNYKISSSYSLWFTGYPSSGKSTIAKLLETKLKSHKIPVLILDGDEIRKNFFQGLKYSKLDRIKSLKFAISVVKFLMQINVIVIISGNHATKEQRKLARQKIKKKYSEIWISSPLSVCKKRDVKNLFKNAKQNNINNLVGHDIKFDKPKNYDLKLDTTKRKVDCVNKLFTFLKNKKILIKK
jgi:adenylylsulfate kinase